ncbi:MAG: WD40 repeat domain-containing protein [Bacteroidales bacterium]|jgi:WD40 repeat protein
MDRKNVNPYPGLRPFTPEESNLFFGRETECDEVISKLLKNRYITVIGASGTGKSSLIYGGVLPKLMNSKIGESSTWRIVSFRPGNDAFGNLAGALSNVTADAGQKRIEREIIFSQLLENPGSFSDVIKEYLVKKDDNVILLIDQFEEIFRYFSPRKSETSQSAAIKFIDFLVNSVANPEMNIFIIVTMCSEYIGECSHYKGLTRLVNNSNYLVPEMGTENLREVIERPVNYAGAKIDPALVETLLNDIKNRSDQLPVLQHTMMRIWARWQELDEPDRPLNKADYDSIGTISDAVSQHADEVYDELNQHEKEICEILFKTITRKGSDNKGIRHPSDIITIRSVAECSEKELFDVIEKFRSSSRSFITPQKDVILNDSSVIDLQNNCIIRLWDRLKDWIDNEDSSMKMYLQISEASALYQQGKAGLYRPPDLLLAINWRDQFNPTLSWAVQYNPAFERAMVYLRTSEKAYLEEEQNRIRQQKRKMKRTRFITRILGTAVLVAVGFILFENVQKLTAERQSVLAEKQRMDAVKEKAIADSFAVIVLKRKIISDSTAAASIQDAEEARKLKIVADVQKSLAEKKTEKALHLKNIAEEQRDGTQRQRMISIGKAMSLKSLQMTGQKDLQTLLAYQAYLFNKRNNGPENDADIYAGLYNVALQYGNINFKSFKGHTGEIKSIAFVPGKNEFYTSGNDGKVLKWSLEKKDQTLQVIYSGSDIIEVLAVSPDASWLACGSSNSAIRMIPLKGNDIGYEMNGHKGGIKSLIFSYDGKYLYSAALDGKVLKWDIAARTSVNVSTGLMEITSIDISTKGNYLAGISADGNVIVWNPEKTPDNFRIETAGKNIKVVKFNPENNLLAIGDAEGTVQLWDINLHKKISEVKAHDGQINDIQFNTTLKQMATAGNDKKLKIFNIKDPADLTEPPVTLTDNEGFVLVMQFSPDGQIIVSGESEGSDNLISRPSHADYLVHDICNMISRNMTQEEWNVYVGKDIPLEKTCPNRSYNIKVEPITSLRK